MPLFKKILIANRGEIACRIIKTARRLGIKSVAVYSEIDAHSLHVKLADEAYLLGASTSSASYLNGNKIIEIAQLAKAEAIHPGYGFLSENAEFARDCEKANIVFVGPSSQAIRIMGEKHLAKDIMKKNHIPVLQDYFSSSQTENDLAQAAEKIGLPLLIKAVAGGGGKGLKLVQNFQDLKHAIASAKREAKASFNDDRVLLEKYLSSCRHIEVQIIADNHNNVVHLFERDCSIQRKHQKIIEEAPANNLDAELKQKIYYAAIQAAKSIDYRNAGTVEFLVSNDKDYYFMEMNTRLQVEHPITEMITGIDIVEWQLRVAANEKLPKTRQDDIKATGHAIEVRINAEDPSKNFMPASGKLEYIKMPSPSAQLRIDTGYAEDDSISIYYDSLIAKLIVHDKNRDNAIVLLKQTLYETQIAGVTTNLFLLKNIAENSTYQNGNITTQFLETNLNLAKQPRNFFTQAIIFASLAMQFHALTVLKKTSNYLADPHSPWFSRDGWQVNLPKKLLLELNSDEEKIAVVINQQHDNFEFSIFDKIFIISHLSQQLIDNVLHTQFEIDQQLYSGHTFIANEKYYVFLNGEDYIFKSVSGFFHDMKTTEDTNHLRAPMPGTIVEIMVNQGQKVVKGDKLLVIEAMKMEHILYAPRDGVIQKCNYTIGDSINEGSELLEISSPEEVIE